MTYVDAPGRPLRWAADSATLRQDGGQLERCPTATRRHQSDVAGRAASPPGPDVQVLEAGSHVCTAASLILRSLTLRAWQDMPLLTEQTW